MVRLGQIIQWATGTGKSLTQKAVQNPAPTLSQMEGVDTSKFKSPQGMPTFRCYEYWVDNVREFDEYGEVTERFMDWFRRNF